MTFKGRIYKVLPIVKGTRADGTTWSRQSVVFEFFERPEDQWSRSVTFSVMDAKIEEYNLQENDEVMVDFALNAKQYNERWYNEVRLLRLTKKAKEQAKKEEKSEDKNLADFAPFEGPEKKVGNDLPF